MRKVISGEPLRIPAPTYNTFIDAANDFLARRHNIAVPRPAENDSELVLVQNASGSDVDRFGVLGISDIVISPTDNPTGFGNQVALVGVTPDADDHEGRFVIVAAPIADGRIGLARVHGVSWVQVDVTDAGHQYAEVKDGDATMLASGETGSAQILWKESGTGTKWAVVRFPFRAAAVNLYERFFDDNSIDDSLTSLSSSNPDATGLGDAYLSFTYDKDWGTWPSGVESRILIHSPHVYGSGRRIADLKLDGRDGLVTVVFDSSVGCEAWISVRAITTDFDPATITWNWAYTEENLGLSADVADHFLESGSGIVSINPFPSRHDLPRSGPYNDLSWNQLDAVYGLEFRFKVSTTSEPDWAQMIWNPEVPAPGIWEPVGYVILEG